MRDRNWKLLMPPPPLLLTKTLSSPCHKMMLPTGLLPRLPQKPFLVIHCKDYRDINYTHTHTGGCSRARQRTRLAVWAFGERLSLLQSRVEMCQHYVSVCEYECMCVWWKQVYELVWKPPIGVWPGWLNVSREKQITVKLFSFFTPSLSLSFCFLLLVVIHQVVFLESEKVWGRGERKRKENEQRDTGEWE